jgi:hypothetical protein
MRDLLIYFEALNVAEICLDDGVARRQIEHWFLS